MRTALAGLALASALAVLTTSAAGCASRQAATPAKPDPLVAAAVKHLAGERGSIRGYYVWAMSVPRETRHSFGLNRANMAGDAVVLGDGRVLTVIGPIVSEVFGSRQLGLTESSALPRVLPESAAEAQARERAGEAALRAFHVRHGFINYYGYIVRVTRAGGRSVEILIDPTGKRFFRMPTLGRQL